MNMRQRIFQQVEYSLYAYLYELRNVTLHFSSGKNINEK